MIDPPREPGRREPTAAELGELARYADHRVALYRRKMYAGRGEPRRLAELERISTGAHARLHTARTRATPEETP